MQTRRDFLKNSGKTALLLGAGTFPLSAFSFDKATKITILHTNDVHSRIEPFPMDGSSRQGLGGAARRAKLIEKIRKEEDHILLLDAGDIFQGTPYFNFFGGELEFKLMSRMGYDAATLGNHDFDVGLEGLVKQLPHATFPFINCNYDFTNTLMEGRALPHKVFQFEDIRIGLIGVGVELDGLVPPNLYGETRYLDPIEKANEEAAFLKKQKGCNFVICLSHLGYQYEGDKVSDIHLAQKTRNIDLILGGHTHTFLDKPDSRRNLDGQEVLINQVGWAGIMLGRLDIYFEKDNGRHCKACNNIPII